VDRVNSQDRNLVTAGLGLAAIGLAGSLLDTIPWPIGGSICVLSLAGAWWKWQRSRRAAEEPAETAVQGGLRIAQKPLKATGRPRAAHALRVTISTEVAVDEGIRVVCDNTILEVEALVQTGRGAAARQGVPPSVRESRQAWLFVARNSPGERELFLRVDIYSTLPIRLQRIEQIRPGGPVNLPAWQELTTGSQAAAPAEPAPAAAVQAEAPPAAEPHHEAPPPLPPPAAAPPPAVASPPAAAPAPAAAPPAAAAGAASAPAVGPASPAAPPMAPPAGGGPPTSEPVA
jgi:hypothetical protein